MADISSVDHLQDLPHSVVSLERLYEDGYVSAAHQHPRHQLLYSTTGLMMVRASNVTWAVPSGFGLLVPAEMEHETKMIGTVRIQTLYVSPSEWQAEIFDQCRVIGISNFLSTVIAELCKEEDHDRLTRRADCLRDLILIELARSKPSPLALRLPLDPKLRRVCDALTTNPSSQKNIDQWAFETGKSRRSFTRAFHLQTGLTFREWTQRLRCQLALTQIAQGESMAKIAHNLGYGSKYSLQKMMGKLLDR